MKKIILLHGRRQRNSDDFEQIIPWIKEVQKDSEIINVSWFDNYKEETLNKQYLLNLLDEVAQKVNPDDEVDIISYSTGALLGPMLKGKFENKDNTRIFSVVPLVVELDNPQIKGYIESFHKKSEDFLEELRKESCCEKQFNERLESLMSNRNVDLLTRETYTYTRELLGEYRGGIVKEENIHFLFSTTDFIIDSEKSIELLKQNGHESIEAYDFHHGLIFKDHSDIFKEWYKKFI